LPKPFLFKSKLQFSSDLEEQELRGDLHLKHIEYSKHEFIKMNEVGLMITEAIQSVLDKLQEKEKLAIANRQQLK
jgi:hypothetical protein